MALFFGQFLRGTRWIHHRTIPGTLYCFLHDMFSMVTVVATLSFRSPAVVLFEYGNYFKFEVTYQVPVYTNMIKY